MPTVFSSVKVQPSATAATLTSRRPTATKSLLRQRQPGLAALTARQHAAACRGTRLPYVRVSAAASTDKAEPDHPYFSDDWKEYNRRFQRPVRRCRFVRLPLATLDSHAPLHCTEAVAVRWHMHRRSWGLSLPVGLPQDWLSRLHQRLQCLLIESIVLPMLPPHPPCPRCLTLSAGRSTAAPAGTCATSWVWGIPRL
jgi:hypothetical protein